MRLLAITNDFPPVVGGIENIALTLATKWDPGEVAVLTRWVRGAERFDRKLDFEVIRVPVGTLLPTPDLFRRAAAIVKERRIDAVYFPTPLPLALLGPRLLRTRGVPYLVQVMGADFIFTSSVPVGRDLVRRALQDAALVVPVSSFLQSAVHRLFPEPPPTEVIPPGVDTERFRPGLEPALSSEDLVIVFVSRLVNRKGADTLIQAMPAVLEAHPRARLRIVGGGPPRYVRSLRRLAESLAGAGAITFTGPKRWDEVPRYLASGDVFAVPTRERFAGLETEGFGIVYLEAAAAGLPAVGGDIGGVPDAIVHGETGYLVDGRDPRSTADALIRLLDDPEKARLMGERGRRRVLEEFTWDSTISRLRAAIERHTG